MKKYNYYLSTLTAFLLLTALPLAAQQNNNKVQVQVEQDGPTKKITIHKHLPDGSREVISWEGEGDIPDDIQQELDKNNTFIIGSRHNAPFAGNMVWVGPSSAFLGVIGEENDPDSNIEGALIAEVLEDSPAEKAGLQEGDIITHLNGKAVRSFDELLEVMADLKAGEEVDISFLRNAAKQDTKATLVKRDGRRRFVQVEMDGNNSLYDNGRIFVLPDIKDVGTNRIVIIRDGLPFTDTTPKGHWAPKLSETPEVKKDLAISDFKVSPNPASDYIQLNFKAEKAPITIRLLDINGRELYKEYIRDFPGTYREDISISDIHTNILFISIEQNKKLYTEKLILNK